MTPTISVSLKGTLFIVFLCAACCLFIADECRRVILHYNSVAGLTRDNSDTTVSTEDTPTFLVNSNEHSPQQELSVIDKLGYGEEISAVRIMSRPVSDSDLKRIEQLKARRLDLFGCTLSPTAGMSLGKVKTLEYLILHNCSFDKDIGESIASLSELRYLSITGGSSLAEECVVELRQLRKLRMLILEVGTISDACAATLSEMSSLRLLTLINSRLTDKAVDCLNRKLHRCQVSVLSNSKE